MTTSTPTIDPMTLAVDARQLGAMLGVSVRHIERMDAGGKLPAPVRIGRAKRWSLAELREWIAAGAPSRAEWEARKGAGRDS